MVDTAVVVALCKVDQLVGFLAVFVLNFDDIAVSAHNFTSCFGDDELARVASDGSFDTRTDRWCLWSEERNCLALHV